MDDYDRDDIEDAYYEYLEEQERDQDYEQDQRSDYENDEYYDYVDENDEILEPTDNSDIDLNDIAEKTIKDRVFSLDTDFSNKNFTNTTFDNVTFSRVVFQEITMRGTRFINCSLKNSTFHNVILINVILNNSSFYKADLKKVTFQNGKIVKCDFSRATFSEGTNFTPTTIEYTRFIYSHLESAKFNGMSLKSIDFEGAILEDARFKGAQLEDVNFKDALLAHSNFRGVNIVDATFWKADLSHAHFNYSHPNKRSFYVDFKEATLIGTNFSSSTIERFDFSEANLTDAKFSYATLNHIYFTEADLLRTNFYMTTGFNDITLTDAKNMVLDKVLQSYAGIKEIDDTKEYNDVYLEPYRIRNYVEEDEDNIVISLLNNYVLTKKSILKKAIDLTDCDNGIVYICKQVYSYLRITKNELRDETKYLNMRKIGLYGLVQVDEISYMIHSAEQFFNMKKKQQDVPSVVSFSVYRPECSQNAVSRSHCQAGQGQPIYEIQMFKPKFVTPIVASIRSHLSTLHGKDNGLGRTKKRYKLGVKSKNKYTIKNANRKNKRKSKKRLK